MWMISSCACHLTWSSLSIFVSSKVSARQKFSRRSHSWPVPSLSFIKFFSHSHRSLSPAELCLFFFLFCPLTWVRTVYMTRNQVSTPKLVLPARQKFPEEEEGSRSSLLGCSGASGEGMREWQLLAHYLLKKLSTCLKCYTSVFLSFKTIIFHMVSYE